MNAAQDIRRLFAELSAAGAEVKEDTLVLRVLQSVSKEGLLSLARTGAEEIVRRALTGEDDGAPVAEEALTGNAGRCRIVYVPLKAKAGGAA